MRILTFVLLLPLLATWARGDERSAGERPSIILLMGDDHGWEETGYNGHPYVKTPVFDEMAATGLRLDRFHAAHPSCSPTRGSVLTGRHPNRYGTFAPGYSLRPEEITIAHLLQEQGYLCGHFGKWHVGTVKKGSPTNPGAMGFHEWVSHDNFFELDPPLSRNGGPPEIYEGESSDVVVEETLRFVERAKGEGKPFFIVAWFGSPHEPYQALPADLELYDDLPAKYPEPEVRLTSNETGLQTKRPLGDVLRERFAEITAMDRAIGTLRDSLDELGLRENTLLWYCGDNGTPSSGAVAIPFRGMKGTIYDGGIRVPGLIEWPARIPEPIRSEVVSVTSDMLPTVCAITRTPLPDRPLDGISLAPVFDGFLEERPGPIFFWEFDRRTAAARNREPYIDPEWQKGTTPLVKLSGGIPTRNFVNHRHPEIADTDYRGARVAREGRWKLVVRDGKGDAPPSRELFDVQADPDESDNLAEAEPAVVEAMEKELRAWQDSVLQSLTGADYGE